MLIRIRIQAKMIRIRKGFRRHLEDCEKFDKKTLVSHAVFILFTGTGNYRSRYHFFINNP